MGSRWWSLGVCFLVSGCAEAREPRVVAAREEAVCNGLAPTADQIAIDPTLVSRVEPFVTHVHSFQVSGPEARMIGAKLHIRPIEGVTSAALRRVLVCHETRQVLGGATSGDDPYSLPHEWVHIGVEPDGAGYVVTTDGQDVRAGRKLLRRALLFAERGPTPLPPPPEDPSELGQ